MIYPVSFRILEAALADGVDTDQHFLRFTLSHLPIRNDPIILKEFAHMPHSTCLLTALKHLWKKWIPAVDTFWLTINRIILQLQASPFVPSGHISPITMSHQLSEFYSQLPGASPYAQFRELSAWTDLPVISPMYYPTLTSDIAKMKAAFDAGKHHEALTVQLNGKHDMVDLLYSTGHVATCQFLEACCSFLSLEHPHMEHARIAIRAARITLDS